MGNSRLILLLLAVVLCLVPTCGSAAPSAPPLTKIQIVGFLAGSTYSDYLVWAVKRRGINFRATEDYLQLLHESGATDNRSVMEHLGSGAVLHQKKALPEAEREFRAALKIDPTNGPIHLALARVLLEQGKPKDGLSAAREAVRIEPDEAELHQKLSVPLEKSEGDFESVVSEQRRAVELEPDYSERHYNLAATLHNKGDFPGAIPEYQEALRLQPDIMDAHYGLGNILKNVGNLEGAISEYQKEIQRHPDHFDARYKLAYALNERGDLDGAVREAREAVRIRPDDTRARVALAAALLDQGRIGRSLFEWLRIPFVQVLLLFALATALFGIRL